MAYNLKSIKKQFKQKGIFYTPPALSALMQSKEFGQDIYLYPRGVKEFLNQPFGTLYYEKNELLLRIDKIMEKAKYMGVSHHKGRISHLFQFKFKRKKAWLIVHEYPGNDFRLYSISKGQNILMGCKKPT